MLNIFDVWSQIRWEFVAIFSFPNLYNDLNFCQTSNNMAFPTLNPKIPIEVDHYIDIKNNSYKKIKFGLCYKVCKFVFVAIWILQLTY